LQQVKAAAQADRNAIVRKAADAGRLGIDDPGGIGIPDLPRNHSAAP